MVFGISGGAWILWHKGVKNSGFVTTIFGRNIPSTWFEEILYLFKKKHVFSIFLQTRIKQCLKTTLTGT
jgi:hypothetical protein